MVPLIPLKDNWKLILGLFFGLVFSILLGIRSCNQIRSESENENEPIDTIIVPKPFDFESNCVRLTNQGCPRESK